MSKEVAAVYENMVALSDSLDKAEATIADARKNMCAVRDAIMEQSRQRITAIEETRAAERAAGK